MAAVGNIYILTNSKIENVCKIGKTNDLDRRLAEINSGAGVAGRWSLAGYVVVNDMDRMEREVHRQLAHHRCKESVGFEIFNCSANFAGSAIILASLSFGAGSIILNKLPEEAEKERKRIDQENNLKKMQAQAIIERDRQAQLAATAAAEREFTKKFHDKAADIGDIITKTKENHLSAINELNWIS